MRPITMGMAVHASDGRAGRVDDVLVDAETGTPAYLVIDAGGFFKGDVVVPYGHVRNVDDSGVWLDMTRDAVKKAASYDAIGHGATASLVSRAAGRYEEDR